MRFIVSIVLVCIAALMVRSIWDIWWLYFAVAGPAVFVLAYLAARKQQNCSRK